MVELASEADDQAAIALASALVILDPALGAAPLAALAAAAPPGVAVVDGTSASAAIAASAPRIVIRVGTPELVVDGTPRGRTGAVSLPGGDPTPAARGADVFWPVSAEAASGLWDELAACLAALAPGASPAAGAKEPPA